jgi:hypothetical protein
VAIVPLLVAGVRLAFRDVALLTGISALAGAIPVPGANPSRRLGLFWVEFLDRDDTIRSANPAP